MHEIIRLLFFFYEFDVSFLFHIDFSEMVLRCKKKFSTILSTDFFTNKKGNLNKDSFKVKYDSFFLQV